MLDPRVFKAHGVRGRYPRELDEEGAYAIARAYVDEFEPRRMAVGRDVRGAAPDLAGAAIAGASDAGADVLDLGAIGTEMLSFAIGSESLEGGIVVVATHDSVRMTLLRRGGLSVGSESGLLAVRDRAVAGGDRSQGLTPGQVRKVDVWPGFVERALNLVDPDAIRPLGIAIDGEGEMAAAMLTAVLERLPVRSRLEPGERFDLAATVDGGRCFFVDDEGEAVPADFVTALLAEAILEQHPGEKVIHDVRASWAVPETVRRSGGIPVPSRVGPAFVQHLMRKEQAVFGADGSGRHYFRDLWPAESVVAPVLFLLELVSRRGTRLSELVRPFRERYFSIGGLSMEVADVPLALQELKERFAPVGRVSHLDGLSVEATEWRLNVRPSSTEPLLRLTLEVRSRELLEPKRDEVLAAVPALRSAP